MSICENWVLKNFPSPFARLGTGAAINALVELIILIFNFYFLFKPHNKRHRDGVHTALRRIPASPH